MPRIIHTKSDGIIIAFHNPWRELPYENDGDAFFWSNTRKDLVCTAKAPAVRHFAA